MSGSNVARARTIHEMEFAASLQPCPNCQHAPPTTLEIYGGDDRSTLAARCRGCDRPRSFSFTTFGNPMQTTERRQLGGPESSQIITAAQFGSELDRLLPQLAEVEVEVLPPSAWRAVAATNDRAITCVLELEKFSPPPRPDLATIRNQLLVLDARFDADAPRIWALEPAAT